MKSATLLAFVVSKALMDDIGLRDRVRAAQAGTHTDPSPGQREAGNYRKGKLRFHGLTVTIETPAGAKRKPWHHALAWPYGYINRTTGADGDHVDVIIGPHPESEIVFVVDQRRTDVSGRLSENFDEHKCVLGCRSEAEARAVYLANYQPGWKGLAAITPMTMDAFRVWLRSGDVKMPMSLSKALAGITLIFKGVDAAKYFEDGEVCPHCGAVHEEDSHTGKCNSCGEKRGGKPVPQKWLKKAVDNLSKSAEFQPRDHRGRWARMTVLTGKEFGPAGSLNELRDKAKAHALANLRGLAIQNRDSGKIIHIDKIGIKHITHGGTTEPVMLSVAGIPQMLRHAVYRGSVPDKLGRDSVKAVHYFSAALRIGKDLYHARMQIRETQNGNMYYHHHLVTLVGKHPVMKAIGNPTPMEQALPLLFWVNRGSHNSIIPEPRQILSKAIDARDRGSTMTLELPEWDAKHLFGPAVNPL